jgi:hypothetical protein
MPTPAYRVPVRVARGTKAALDAGLADLQEGEICYATDENTLYSVEGGILTSTKSTVDLANIELINDLTPQLGGNLDVNGFDIVSLSGAIDIGSANGELVVRGGSSEGKITLNCTANTHGVSIQSPPHSSGATYTLTLPDNTGTSGQSLTTDGSGGLSWATPSAVGSIDDLTDVDTTTAAPTDGQALVWDNANSEWIPGNVAADIGATSIDALSDVDTSTAAPTNDQVLAWNGTNWVPADQAGGSGGGGGGSSAARLVETQTAASGIATFSGIGHSGTLVDVTSSLDAWIVFYDSAASRTSDSSRAYDTDPSTGSGVLAEFYITSAGTVLATPGTTYFNNDTSVTEAIYVAVRDQAGASVDSQVTVTAYGNQIIASISGGTFGSGV